MKQRVLVLGAGGFIGSSLVDALSASQWAVPIAAYRRLPVRPIKAETRIFDAMDPAALASGLRGIDHVVNCVAGSVPAIARLSRLLTSLLNSSADHIRLVHISSMAVYGAAVGTVSETAALSGELSAYAAAKLAAEREVSCCPSAIVLRPGCIYGAGSDQWTRRIAALLYRRRLGDLGAAGDGYGNLVYLDDVTAAILQCLRLPGIEGQAFNLGSPSPGTWNDYFLAFGKALGAPPIRRLTRRRLAIETQLIAPQIRILELAARALGQRRLRLPPSIPPSLLRLWGQEIKLDVHKAQDQLKLRWTSLETGLNQTCASYRQERDIRDSRHLV